MVLGLEVVVEEEMAVAVVAVVVMAVAAATMTEVVQEEVGVVGVVVLPEDVPPQEVRHEGVGEEEQLLLPTRPS